MAVHNSSMPWQVFPYEDNRYEIRCRHAFTFEKGFANTLVSMCQNPRLEIPASSTSGTLPRASAVHPMSKRATRITLAKTRV
jgi:hypothetical protein